MFLEYKDSTYETAVLWAKLHMIPQTVPPCCQNWNSNLQCTWCMFWFCQKGFT